MAPGKNPLRDKLDEDVLDLSLMQLEEVPVKEICSLPKGTTLDLSNNLLTTLPDTFPALSHLVKLDLSKNQLRELPEYFGQLKSLRHLDLYSNQLERLPVSFAQLKSLKWLDLKNNPLVPALQQAAGPCITANDCALCAKKVVALLQSMQSQLERERQKHVIEEQKLEAARRAAEEQERERIRAEKRAAKERRREEARRKEEANRREMLGSTNAMQHEMEKPKTSAAAAAARAAATNGVQNGRVSGSGSRRSGNGWCWSMFMFLLGLCLVVSATFISMLWVYTGGQLDRRSIDLALPVMQHDVVAAASTLTKKAGSVYEQSQRSLGPYVQEAGKKATWAWQEFVRRNQNLAHYVNQQWGPSFCALKQTLWQYFAWLQSKAVDAWTWLKPQFYQAWLTARPYFQRLGEIILEQINCVCAWVQKNGPIYYDLISQKIVEGLTAVDGWING